MMLEREIDDVDLVVVGDPEDAARSIAGSVGGAVFSLSDQFGGWRVIAPDGEWQADISTAREGGIESDLRQRDFTVNAMAVPIEGGDLIDPTRGLRDLESGILRVVDDSAYEVDPLRVMRLARIAAEYDFDPEEESVRSARRSAAALKQVSGERVFYELRKLVTADGALSGIELLDRVGAIEVVIPELAVLKGVEQTQYHHLDAYDHTIEVLRCLLQLEDDLSVVGDLADKVSEALAQPVADELDAAQTLRFAALFHDMGKSETRAVTDEGRVTFMGHDRVGKKMCAAICRRLRTSTKLSRYLEHLTLNHLTLGFLVHERPLTRLQIYSYITACEPVALEVTVLSIADRMATKGERTKEGTIGDHLELAREMIGEVVEWRKQRPRGPLVGGDELMAKLSIEPGPVVGELLERIEEARFIGEIDTEEEALALARRVLER